MNPRLHEAARAGDTATLHELLQQDPLLLHAITQTNSDTALHIAALLGHVDFAKLVMHHNPGLAHELNLQGLSPMHLASAKGHLQIVKDMLDFDPTLVLVIDQDSRTPLHYAAIKGRLQVLKELISFQPSSAKERTQTGETVLHLAVKNNQYQALATLVELIKASNLGDELFNSKDDENNTILHCASERKLSKMVKFLVCEANVDVNSVNSEGFTALDIVLSDQDWSNEKKMEEILRLAGGHEQKKRGWQKEAELGGGAPPRRSERLIYSLKNGIMIMAVMFATLSFEVALNPPGGVWQEWPSDGSSNTSLAPIAPDTVTRGDFFSPLNLVFVRVRHWDTSYIPILPKAQEHEPGKAVNRELHTRQFVVFLLYDAVCFFTSLSMVVVVTLIETLKWENTVAAAVLSILTLNLVWFAGLTFRTGMALVTGFDVSMWILYAGLYNLAVTFLSWLLLILVTTVSWSYLKNKLPFLNRTHRRRTTNSCGLIEICCRILHSLLNTCKLTAPSESTRSSSFYLKTSTP